MSTRLCLATRLWLGWRKMLSGQEATCAHRGALCFYFPFIFYGSRSYCLSPCVLRLVVVFGSGSVVGLFDRLGAGGVPVGSARVCNVTEQLPASRHDYWILLSFSLSFRRRLLLILR